jgi:hypothetical protein
VLESRWTIDPRQLSDGCRIEGSERLAPGAGSPSRFGRYHVLSELCRCCAAALDEPAFSNELRRAGKPDAPPHGDKRRTTNRDPGMATDGITMRPSTPTGRFTRVPGS